MLLCKTCESTKKDISPPLKVKTLLNNSKFAKQLFYDYKFKHKRSFAPIFSDLLLKHFFHFLSSFDIYLPITLPKRDYYYREFCPVLKITKQISKVTKIPICLAIVRKKGNTKKQREKTREERKTIYKEYFFKKKLAPRFKDKKVLLIDDVSTTTETLKAAFKHLTENAKPKSVEALSFLRTPQKESDDFQF